jgi:hypothetical protein
MPDEQPIHDFRPLDALEACRPGSDDLSDPALAPLAAEMAVDPELERRYHCVQQADRRIAEAFDDVPVPAGLRQRVLRRLAEEAAGAVVPAVDPELPPAAVSTPPAEAALPSPPRPARIVSRRRLAAVAACVGAAAALLAVVWLNLPRTPAYTPQTVLADAQEFFSRDAFGTGSLLSEASAPRDWPFSREMVRGAGIRWRRVEGLLGGSGVAYDLPGPPGVRATVYVVGRTIPGLPSRPPRRPPWNTGGCMLGAWQEGGLVYVLAVQGRESDYRAYLDVPIGPVAWSESASPQHPSAQSSKSV